MKTWIRYGLLNASVIIIYGALYTIGGQYVNYDTIIYFIASAFALFLSSGILWKLRIKELPANTYKIIVNGFFIALAYPIILTLILTTIKSIFSVCFEGCHPEGINIDLEGFVGNIYIFSTEIFFGATPALIGFIINETSKKSFKALYLALIGVIFINSGLNVFISNYWDKKIAREGHEVINIWYYISLALSWDEVTPEHGKPYILKERSRNIGLRKIDIYDDNFSRFYNFCHIKKDIPLNKKPDFKTISSKKEHPKKKQFISKIKAPNNSISKDRQFISKYENGQVKVERNWKDDKPDGLWKEWHKNGQLKKECNYKEGSRDGIHKEWYEGGQIKKEKIYVNGNAEGLYREWHKNGQLAQECTLITEAHAIGLFRTWYDNGQIKSKNNLTLNDHWAPYADGTTQTWHRNGQLKTESLMKDRKILSSKSWNENGKQIK